MSKSWGGTKKRLETDLLCEKLQGKIKYFYTEYHYLDEEWYGRFAIRYNGEEVFISSNYDYNYYWDEIFDYEKKYVQGENEGYWDWSHRVDALVIKDIVNKGHVPVKYFKKYFDEFFHTDIKDAINHENPVIRMLAVLDRRVGVRTLQKIALNLNEQPEWLRNIYKIRLDAEDIKYDCN